MEWRLRDQGELTPVARRCWAFAGIAARGASSWHLGEKMQLLNIRRRPLAKNKKGCKHV